MHNPNIKIHSEDLTCNNFEVFEYKDICFQPNRVLMQFIIINRLGASTQFSWKQRTRKHQLTWGLYTKWSMSTNNSQ
jgi:hypothetical protein